MPEVSAPIGAIEGPSVDSDTGRSTATAAPSVGTYLIVMCVSAKVSSRDIEWWLRAYLGVGFCTSIVIRIGMIVPNLGELLINSFEMIALPFFRCVVFGHVILGVPVLLIVASVPGWRTSCAPLARGVAATATAAAASIAAAVALATIFTALVVATIVIAIMASIVAVAIVTGTAPAISASIVAATAAAAAAAATTAAAAAATAAAAAAAATAAAAAASLHVVFFAILALHRLGGLQTGAIAH
jgi:hypothetical protein